MDYVKLIEDSKSGKLTTALQVDGDCMYWCTDDYNLRCELGARYGVSNGDFDFTELLKAAGVDCEKC